MSWVEQQERQSLDRRFTRRAILVGSCQAAFLGILVARMRYLQVNESDRFRLLAEENRINSRLIAPERGEILDRNGILLATNAPSYRVVIVPEEIGRTEEIDAVIDRLTALLNLKPVQLKRLRKEISRSPPFLPVTVADDLEWDEISRVAVNAPVLPGVVPEVGLARRYPRGGDFAHVVGYVGPVSESDLARLDDPDPVLRIPRFQIGKVGLEDKFESRLRGTAGVRHVEVNASGRVMRELERRDGVKGASIRLALDAGLQGYVQARLGEESAAAVAIECETGEIRAIASSPSFDPNLFVRGISTREYRALTSSERRPLANKAVQGAYPPGSVFKIAVALAALDSGMVETDEEVYCPGHHQVGDRRFHCWRRGGHGAVNLHESLAQSCDVYFYSIAERLGIEWIARVARRLGLGIRYEIPMTAVARGLVPDIAWKRAIHDQPWLPGDTANAAIGQGFVLATPLQLAVMTSRVATGRAIVPRLAAAGSELEREGNEAEGAAGPDDVAPGHDLGFDAAHLAVVRDAMGAVCNDRGGTAYGSRIIDERYRMGGKTGTSQVRNITAEERAAGVTDNEDLPWERRDHALFVNFAPVEAPRIAVAVVVEHGGGGSRAAAPIARDVTLQALVGGTPPLEAYPQKDREKIRLQQQDLRRQRPRGGEPGNRA